MSASIEQMAADIAEIKRLLQSLTAGSGEIRPSIGQEIAIGRMNGKTAIQVLEDRYKSTRRRDRR